MHRRAIRLWRLAIAGAALLGMAGLLGGLWMVRPVDPREAGPPARTVVIPEGESASGIGRRLADAGLVRRGWVFVAVARLYGVNTRLRAGEYALRPSQSLPEIVGTIARGESVRYRVTVPEGFTAVQIADLLAAAGIVDRDQFLALVLRGGRTLEHPAAAELPIDSLEGYLFPDTYEFARGMNASAVARRFLDEFDARVAGSARQAGEVRGLTLHQVLTIASLVEREALKPDERPLVAGVIYNRLARRMPLEIDASVLYALGEHKPVVTLKDLEVSSPYNTYRHEGLPPGPIANPGLASIKAALAPASAPFLYYVLKPDGSHHFSRTFQEHVEAVRRYRP